MKKFFVLDTNVLLHDPNAILNFGDNDVVIPIYVIEEIDRFKKELSELGRNARVVGRMIDKFRASGRLNEGVVMPTGGILKVMFTNRQLPAELGIGEKMDHKILAVAFELTEREEKPTIFITKDTNLRIKADSLGITAKDYDTERVAADEIYGGVSEVKLPGEMIDTYYREGYLEADKLPEHRIVANQFIHLKDEAADSHGALGRINPEGTQVNRFSNSEAVFGVFSRAIANRHLPLIFSWMIALSWSLWPEKQVPERHSWPWLQVCTKPLRKVCFNVYWYRDRFFLWAEISVFYLEMWKTNSIPGCNRFLIMSSCS